eukprot:XP_001706863.1 Hypothetical protein GL50803_93877 [Giardia lamblia ATCC 50803]
MIYNLVGSDRDWWWLGPGCLSWHAGQRGVRAERRRSRRYGSWLIIRLPRGKGGAIVPSRVTKDRHCVAMDFTIYRCSIRFGDDIIGILLQAQLQTRSCG